MAVAAPVIVAEMRDWVALGGRNSGIVGNDAHTSGFHRAASEVPATDYSRRRDPNGPDGPYTSWSYACAGDFWHGDDPRLLAYHRRLLARLEAGELPMICEFIGQPDPAGPVIYWSRWGGRSLYRGAGHGEWSHISWYRSRANQRAYLWEDDVTKDEIKAAVREVLDEQVPLRSQGLRNAHPALTNGVSDRGLAEYAWHDVGQLRDQVAALADRPPATVTVDYDQLADAIVRRVLTEVRAQ